MFGAGEEANHSQDKGDTFTPSASLRKVPSQQFPMTKKRFRDSEKYWQEWKARKEAGLQEIVNTVPANMMSQVKDVREQAQKGINEKFEAKMQSIAKHEDELAGNPDALQAKEQELVERAEQKKREIEAARKYMALPEHKKKVVLAKLVDTLKPIFDAEEANGNAGSSDSAK